jgi:signal transduction histidine kinase
MLTAFERPSTIMSNPTFDPQKRILLIEDNPADARLVELFLEETDLISVKIINKQSLSEGIAAVHAGEIFDAVMLDLTLPDSRGFETLQRFMLACPDLNVIVMTGLADKKLGLKAVQAGAQDFIVKGSLDSDQLGKSLRYAIERGAVLTRLEETQRIAHIGNWEFDRQIDVFTGSTELFRIFDFKSEKKSFDAAELFGGENPFSIFEKLHEDAFVHGESETESEFLTTHGDRRFVYLKCQRDKDGQTLYGIAQDVSERRRGEDLRKQHEVSQQATRMKEKFIASVSHEMRTPMNAILGMSNLVLGAELGPEQRGYIQTIKQSSEILLGIVNDILEISTLQNGVIEFERRPYDFKEVLTNLMNVMHYKIDEKALKLDFQLAPNVPKVLRGDKLRLNQILFNLVGNAIKFTDAGEVRVLVKTFHGNSLLFEISDTGIGIPQDQLDAVFESFTRVKYKNRLFEGTGLGLSIARNLVIQQGGKIWAESEVGSGSNFFFTLPMEAADESELVNERNIARPRTTVDANRAFNLLLVEDHKMNQLVAKKTLEKKFSNIKITIAENGRDAVDLIQKMFENLGEKQFDIVLMDIQMPIMDGNEATDFVRKNLGEKGKNIPILAMTAHAHISKNDQFREFGFNDFVLKPFEPEQLFEKIADYAFK